MARGREAYLALLTRDNRLVRWLSTTRFRLAVTWAVIVYGVFLIVFLVLLAPPRTLSYIDARVETMSYLVVNADLAPIRAQGRYLSQSEELVPKTGCVELKPALRSLVTYTRGRGTGLIIEVAEPDDNMVLPDDASYALVDASTCDCEVGSGDIWNTCGRDVPLRLPVRGPGTLGVLLGSADNKLLLSGTLGIYGRSLHGGSLYPVSEGPLSLPVGSVVSTAELDVSPESAFVGFAESDESGLSVSLTTEAREISLRPPGSSIRPMRITISKFARLFEDPFILQLQIYLLAFIFVMQLAANMLEWRETKYDAPTGRGADVNGGEEATAAAPPSCKTREPADDSDP